VRQLSGSRVPDEGGLISAEGRNLSDGGLCVILSEPVAPSSILRCNILWPGSSVSLPMLARVRWTQPLQETKFLTGIDFLF
jgi:hypothetical protein